ncbi:type VII secretion integral membrane protein EccD [Corynebacterium sp. UBA2622]|uniref:type VII secretion integral membrane protein EccD n=1 Tax=Corynebacterium sp. UBA2622 TaxID=1946393 RepID=UPI0025BEC55F|nr:type VII secretion integral membrane protein EccD [Corynebacterium sp. UBA2622]
MVATSAHHIVRVTVRVDVVSFHRDVDLTLPTSSSLGEILPELSRLVELPAAHRPWQATTAAGVPLDMHTPLYQLKLRDGSVLVLRPQEPVDPPVVRDAAESLAAAAEETPRLPGADTAASAVGCAVLAAAALPVAGAPGAFAVAAAPLLFLGFFTRSRVLYVLGALSTAAGCGTWVAGAPAEWASPTDPAIGALSAAAVLALLGGSGALLRVLDAATASALLTVPVLATPAAAGAWLPSPDAPPAVAGLGSLLAVAAAPGAATRLAGLRVPRIPTAGEEFSLSDGYQTDVDLRARRARSIAAGITAGAGAVAAPALLALGLAGGGWPTVMCLCTLGAVAFHAARLHYPVPRAALTSVSLSAALACGLAAAQQTPAHPAVPVLAVALGLTCASAVLWAPRVPDLEPTALVWFERAEAAALIASLPVAVHVTGAFDLVRGL